MPCLKKKYSVVPVAMPVLWKDALSARGVDLPYGVTGKSVKKKENKNTKKATRNLQ